MPFNPVKKIEKEKEFKPTKKVGGGSKRSSVSDMVTRVDPNSPTSYPQPDSEIIRNIGEQFSDPRIAGATAGALYGMRGGPQGALAGAVAGGMLGEGAKLGKQYFVDGKPVTLKEGSDRVIMAGFKSAGEELLGAGVAGVAGKVLYPFGKRLTKQGRIARQTLEKYMPRKVVPFLPAEITEHRGLDVLHNIAENSFFGGQTMATYKNIVRPPFVDAMVDDMVNKFGKSVDADTMGRTIVDIAENQWKRFKEVVAKPMYNRVGLRAEFVGAEHSAGKVKFTSRAIQIPTKKLKAAVKDKQKINIASESSGDNLVAAIRDLPEKVDYDVAMDLRSRLRTVAEDFSTTNKNAPAIGMAKHLGGLIDETITTTLKNESPEAYKLWRTANYVYKNALGRYRNKFVKSLINKAENAPEDVLKSVFKNGGVTSIQRIKNIVGQKQWQRLKGWHVRQMLSKATKKDGVVDGEAFLKNMFGATGMGEQAIKKIYSKEEIALLKNNAITLGVLNARQAKGAGGMMIQLAQPGALVGGATTGRWGPAVAVFVGPEVLARMMLSPKINRWMLRPGSLPKSTGVIGSTTARLAGFADEIEKQLSSEQEQ